MGQLHGPVVDNSRPSQCLRSKCMLCHAFGVHCMCIVLQDHLHVHSSGGVVKDVSS
jgi:hypothetical protein